MYRSAGAGGPKTGARLGLLWFGTDGDSPEGSGHGRPVVSQVARADAGAAGQGVGPGVLGQAVNGCRGAGERVGVFPECSPGGRRVGEGARGSSKGIAANQAVTNAK